MYPCTSILHLAEGVKEEQAVGCYYNYDPKTFNSAIDLGAMQIVRGTAKFVDGELLLLLRSSFCRQLADVELLLTGAVRWLVLFVGHVICIAEVHMIKEHATIYSIYQETNICVSQK